MSLLDPKMPENHLQNFSSFSFSLRFSNKHSASYINTYSKSFLSISLQFLLGLNIYILYLPKFEKLPWNNSNKNE